MSSVSVEGIAKELVRLHGELSKNDVNFAMTSTQNTILVGGGRLGAKHFDRLLSELCEVCPSRFFVIELTDKVQSIEVDASAVCHKVGSEGICSEIIKVKLPPNSYGKIASIVRSNLVSGRATEIFFLDDEAVHQLGSSLGPLGEGAYFDSSDFEYGLTTVSHIKDLRLRLVDLEWLRLSGWRDFIRSGFERAALRTVLNDLTEIVVKGCRAKPKRSVALDLMAGWIVSRLGLSVVVVDENELSLIDSRKKPIVLRMYEESAHNNDDVEEVSFFGENGTVVTFHKGDNFEIRTSGLPKVNVHRVIDSSQSTELLRRYFLIGESVANYERSLRIALKIINPRDKGRL